MTRQARMFLVALGTLLLCGAKMSTAQEAQPEAKLDFERTGPQVGEQVPDLRLYTLKGEEQRLSDAWQGGPALLVTSSLTCPKSRSRWPELKALVDRYEDRLNIVIVYVIEAHPVGSPCPYKGVEDITPENERDGILRKQPKTIEDRLELAQEFKRLLRINTPIYVDNMKDEAWKGLGSAPNLALLIDREGNVAARNGWFEGKKSEEGIERLLDAAKANQPQPRQQREDDEDPDRAAARSVYELLNKAGFESHDIRWSISDEKESEKLARMLKAVPAAANLKIEAQQGHPYHSTILMDAVRERNSAAVELLLNNGADVKARTESYDSALQIAAGVGDVEIGKMLLAKGADPAFPRPGKSPLHEAALHGHKEFVKLLLDAGLRHDLYSAIALGEVDMIRRGLKADPSRALRPDGAGRMPMDYAAGNGQLEIAKLLVAHGAPLVRDARSRIETPLHRAIGRRDEALTELLLASGSSPNISVGRGGEYPESNPALHHAVAQKSLPIVKLLLNHKADLKARDTYSQTALHDAASTGQAEIAAALIEAGADVNAPQLGYELPCGSGQEEIPTYTTPLHFAASWGNVATLRVLIAAGAKVDAATNKGRTPLMQAVSMRRYEREKEESRIPNVELLLASGADINAKDKDGQSVLDIATSAYHGDDARSKQDHEEMLALLQKHGAKAGDPAAKKQPRREID